MSRTNTAQATFNAGPVTAVIEKWQRNKGYGELAAAQCACGFLNEPELLVLTTFHLLVHDALLALVFREMMLKRYSWKELKPPAHIVADDILEPDDLKESLFVEPAEITDQAEKQTRMQQSVEWYLKMLNHLLNTQQRSGCHTLIRCTLYQDRGEAYKVASFKFALPYNILSDNEKKRPYGWPFDALLLQIEISKTDTNWNALLQGLSHENCGETTYRVEEMERCSQELANMYGRNDDGSTWWIKSNLTRPFPLNKEGCTPNSMYTGTEDIPGEIMQFMALHDSCLTNQGDSGRGVFIKYKQKKYYVIAGMLTHVVPAVNPTMFFCQPVHTTMERFKKLYGIDPTLLGQHLKDRETNVASETRE